MKDFLVSIKKRQKFGSFWKSREDFYKDVAKSLQSKELFRDFLEGEYQIARSPRTRDKQKAKALLLAMRLQETGKHIFEILAEIMPDSDRQSLKVANDAENGADVLFSLAKNIEEQNLMTKEIREGMLPPMVLLPIAFVFSWVLASFSIPVFEEAAPPEVWTGFAWLVREVAQLFALYAPFILIVSAVLLALLMFWGLENITAKWRYWLEDVYGPKAIVLSVAGSLVLLPVQPILSVYRTIQSSRMLGNLAILLQAGNGLQEALDQLAKASTPWMRKHLYYILEHLKLEPGSYVKAFTKILPHKVLARLASSVRRDSGQDFANVLIEIGTKGQVLAREDVKKMTQETKLWLLVVSFGLIVFFYAGQNYIAYRLQVEMSPAKVQMRVLESQQGRS